MDRDEINTKHNCGIGIAEICARDGIEPVNLGDNGRPADQRLTLFTVGDREAIATNGDPVWDGQDGFDELRAEIMDEPEPPPPPREIDVCSNTEWWRVMGPAGDIEDDNDILDMIGDIRAAIRDLGHDDTSPRGQRILLHGWNGANTFARKSGGIGTFAKFTAEEWNEINGAVDAVIERHCAKATAAV